MTLRRANLSYHSPVPNPTLNLGALSPELLLHIADSFTVDWCAGQAKTLNALARTCKRFYAVLNPCLYRTYSFWQFKEIASKGNVDSIRLAVAYGGFVTPPNFEVPWIIQSATIGNLEYLVEAGLIGLQQLYPDPIPGITDTCDLTALQIAISHRKASIAHAFLQMGGFDVDIRGGWDRRYTALEMAIQRGLTDIVKCLLEKGADPNLVDASGLTPLHEAAKAGSVPIVNLLIEAGADVSAIKDKITIRDLVHDDDDHDTGVSEDALVSNDGGALEIVVSHEDVESREDGIFYHDGTRVKLTAFYHDGCPVYPDAMGSPRVSPDYEDRMDKYADMLATEVSEDLSGAFNLLRLTCKHDHVEILRLLIREGINLEALNDNGSTALMFASGYGAVNCVKLLLDHGAQVNQSDQLGTTAMWWAVSFSGCPETIQLLLEYGTGDLSIGRGLAYYAERSWKFALPTLAVGTLGSENLPALRLLLQHGLPVNYKDGGGMTPIHIAIASDCRNSLQLVIDFGGDMSIRDSLDRTPMEAVVIDGQHHLLEILLANGADTRNLNCRRPSALYLACECGDTEAVKILLKHGASKSDSQDPRSMVSETIGPNSVEVVKTVLDKALAGHMDGIDGWVTLAKSEADLELLRLLIAPLSDVSTRTSLPVPMKDWGKEDWRKCTRVLTYLVDLGHDS